MTKSRFGIELAFENHLQAAEDRLLRQFHRPSHGLALVFIGDGAEFVDDFRSESTNAEAMQICAAFHAQREDKTDRGYCGMRNLLIRARVDDFVDQHGSLHLHIEPLSLHHVKYLIAKFTK